MAAWKTGSDFVKVFPCFANGGPAYIQALKGPFSEVPMIATGGVNQMNAMDFIRAGAVALGIGRDLIHQDAIRRRERGWITELARRYRKMVAEARSIQKEAGVMTRKLAAVLFGLSAMGTALPLLAAEGPGGEGAQTVV